MKKIIYLLAIVSLFMFIFSACEKDDTNPVGTPIDTNQTDTTDTNTNTKELTIFGETQTYKTCTFGEGDNKVIFLAESIKFDMATLNKKRGMNSDSLFQLPATPYGRVDSILPVYDPEFGYMFNFQGAKKIADNTPDWRLPTFEELVMLEDNSENPVNTTTNLTCELVAAYTTSDEYWPFSNSSFPYNTTGFSLQPLGQVLNSRRYPSGAIKYDYQAQGTIKMYGESTNSEVLYFVIYYRDESNKLLKAFISDCEASSYYNMFYQVRLVYDPE